MNISRRERVLGVVGAVFGLAYIAQARAIEDSLLSDAVGAGGVPQAAGIVLLLASLVLIVKSFLARATAPAEAVAERDASGVGQQIGHGVAVGAAMRRGAALVAALVVYAWLLPRLGYMGSISVLVLAVAVLAGARRESRLLLFAALSGVALWAMFDLALKIRMPVGSLWG